MQKLLKLKWFSIVVASNRGATAYKGFKIMFHKYCINIWTPWVFICIFRKECM
jgi:hypothetical protein